MPKVALVLAGSVAKGAYAAGALARIAEADVEIVRIVATSAGALNAVGYARGLRARDARGAAAQLEQLWLDEATPLGVFHPSLVEIAKGEGFSDSSKILALLREHVIPVTAADRAEIELRLICAPLAGSDGAISDRVATTYERVLVFDGATFDSAAGLAPLFDAAAASAALPFVFAPVEVPGNGPCVDGGAVNNTPIKWALGTLPDGRRLGPYVDAIIVVAPIPERVPPPESELRGIALAAHLVEMLINERLYRDLREADQRNTALRALAALPLDPDLARRVINALDWDQVQEVPIVQIRPVTALPGHAFTGFFERSAREAYVQRGRDDAANVLASRGWLPGADRRNVSS
ncbi:MAG TPA: patatin-like phospholipase family protein [Kofleriaceae bacterium]|nr:patatin-like phospholipase family protein [Kofleriaceae bacterium]